ncbi:membrane-spanning 4-domains subfamily A member 4D-like isoform X3 [Pseudoliparis swirei]|nr:membrane-spanning 4-domains subfamily A member 4D-like isoform X3 [Pseudoliparis swirei]
MEETESTTIERTTGQDGHQAADHMLSKSSKPLHRFVQKGPRILGIVILICGCAEVLMGFVLTREEDHTSHVVYIPFWQGALFLICGNLSIYTEIHPSKKMVTVCLAMYMVSLLGLVVSIAFRISFFTDLRFRYNSNKWSLYKMDQLLGIEGILFTSSLCVSGLLIFLSAVARLALKSTHTGVIVLHIPAPPSSTSN